MEAPTANNSVFDPSLSHGSANASETHYRALQASHAQLMQPSAPSDEASFAFEDEDSQGTDIESTLPTTENTQRYQPLQGNDAESIRPSPAAAAGDTGSLEEPSAASECQWQPGYLRLWVLVAFSITFFVMIALLEALNILSTRNGAIAKCYNKNRYLWTYGPPAFFTLVATLFSRVEYQAKLIAPWERLSKGPRPAQKNLLLDYVSAWPPVVIYESMANKDFAVTATTTISLVIKILIVLSSGCFTLSRIPVHYAKMPMEIQSTFVNNHPPVGLGTHLPYFTVHDAIWGTGYSKPQGISNKFAYQVVQSNLPDTAQFQVVVDGLSTSLKCDVAELHASNAVVGKFYSLMNVTTKSTGCDGVTTRLLGPLPPLGNSTVFGPGQVAFGRVEQINCNDATNDAGKRFLIMFGLEEWTVDEAIPPNEVITDELCPTGGCVNNLRGRLVKSTQLVCAPQYEITKVVVVQNATEVSITRAGKSSNRTLDGVSPWDFVRSYLSSFRHYVGSQYDLTLWTEFKIGHNRLDVDQFMYTILEAEAPTGTTVTTLYDPAFIQSIATTYFQRVGAVIAQQVMMEPASLTTTGSATIVEDRLATRGWVVHCMAGLLSFCLSLSLVTSVLVSNHGTLHQAPNTLHGIAALVAHSPDLLNLLRYSGDADSKKLRLHLKGSTFQSELIRQRFQPPILSISSVAEEKAPTSAGRPSGTIRQSPLTHSHPWILHPASRLGLGLIFLALVIALEVVLRQSQRHDGLGDVGESAYIQHTWTSLPAIVFGGLAMILSSMDFSIRSLAPYTCLSDVVAGNTFRTLDLLDMSVPSAMFKEAKLRNIGALASTTNLLVASLFTVFSGSLYQTGYLSTTTRALLRVDKSFGTPSRVFDVAPPLVLLSNRSYPSFTHEDLAFPQFIPEVATAAQGSSNTSQLSITAVLPALRSRLDCRLYNVSIIRIEKSESAAGKTLVIDIDDKRPRYAQEWSGFISINPETLYFGTENVIGYDHNYFSWGYIDSFADAKVGHIAVMGCNQSIEILDVETTFIGAHLAIDVNKPPRTLPDTGRALSGPPGLKSLVVRYATDLMPVLSPIQDTDLSGFFTLLTHSKYAIHVSLLGGVNDDAVADAIKFQHGIFFAQALNKARSPATETNVLLDREQVLAGENDSLSRFTATVEDKAGRQRVKQDETSTRVLQALLLVTLILLGVGWMWLPHTNVLPKRSPNTIASAVALLAGGNLTEWLHEEDGCVDMMKFWLGWGDVADEEGLSMGGGNEDRCFGIFAIKADPDDNEQMGSLHGTTIGDWI